MDSPIAYVPEIIALSISSGIRLFTLCTAARFAISADIRVGAARASALQ
jgi:hypothetical protein